MIFKNPNTGVTESAELCFLWCLLFGPMYFIIKRVYVHAMISTGLAILTVGISMLVYPFFARTVIENHYAREGWKRV